MIANRADSLPVWSLGDLNSGKYGPNTVVFHKGENTEAGYAYRANLQFNSEHPQYQLPPDEATQIWEIDKSYASEWKNDGRYAYYGFTAEGKQFANRVYYHNGQKAYIYKTTPRYFGGHQPPNEEVDEDGYRTWELEQDYRALYENQTLSYPRRFTSWTVPVPVAKKIGLDGVWGLSSWWDNGRITLDANKIFPWNYIGHNVEIEEKPPFSKYTNVFESNPYDENTYSFLESGGSGSEIWFKHRMKGIHKTQVLKENEGVLTKDKQYYKRQIQGTDIIFRNTNYYSAFGFSCEFWQERPDSEWEFNIANLVHYTPSGLLPDSTPRGTWNVSLVNERRQTLSLGGATSDSEASFTIIGQQTNQDGTITYVGDSDASQIPVYFQMGDQFVSNKPQWLGRELKIHLLTVSYNYWFQERYSPLPPPDGTVYYEQKFSNYYKNIITFTLNTSESNFSFPADYQPYPDGNGYYSNINRIGSINLQFLVRPRMTSYVYLIGVEVGD